MFGFFFCQYFNWIEKIGKLCPYYLIIAETGSQIGTFLGAAESSLNLKGQFAVVLNTSQEDEDVFQLEVMRKILRLVAFFPDDLPDSAGQPKYSAYFRSVCTANSSQFLGTWAGSTAPMRLFGPWFDLDDLSCRKFRATAFPYSPYTELDEDGHYGGIEASSRH